MRRIEAEIKIRVGLDGGDHTFLDFGAIWFCERASGDGF